MTGYEITEGTTTMHTRNVPIFVKAQFKAYCATFGYTMEDAIIALMKQATREQKPLTDASMAKRKHF